MKKKKSPTKNSYYLCSERGIVIQRHLYDLCVPSWQLRSRFNSDKQGIIDFTKKNKSDHEPQTPEKLTLSRIKYETSRQKIEIPYCTMSEKYVKNTQICVLWPNQVHF